MTNGFCEKCGRRYIGFHNCSHRESPRSVTISTPVVVPALKVPEQEPVAKKLRGYKYRDADKWRAYMRDYMRRKRKGDDKPS